VRRTIATLFGIAAAVCAMPAQAEVTVMAVRLGATDVVALAKFYEAAFGLKEIDRVGNPATEIIMRYGATVADAKAGASPEFLVQKREATAAKMGFSAYGVTQGDDPVAQAMKGLIDNAAGHEHQIALLWQAIETLSERARELPGVDCVPQDAHTTETFDAAALSRLVK